MNSDGDVGQKTGSTHGMYNYWKNAGDRCGNCGTIYDWVWNVESGRISEGSIPADIDSYLAY